MKWKALSKTDANMYKGLAILMIVLHNFMHLFPKPKEMEFGFQYDYFLNFLELASQPENFIQATLSFLGHFGVQVFVFLSAYGLTKRYPTNKFRYWPYMGKRFITIYPSFLLAITLYAVVADQFESGLLGPLKHLYWSFGALILKITLLSNFVAGQEFYFVGPWWFISFIFQFYFIFPLLLHLHSRWPKMGLLLISILSIVFTAAVDGEIANVNLYFTVIAHLPEFCLGIYLAKHDEAGLKIPVVVLLIALVTYILGNIFEAFWYLNHISFLILLLAMFSFIMPIANANKGSRKLLMFFGAISMPLFLVNGFLRKPFITWAISHDNWLLTIALCLLSLGVSTVMALMLLKTENYLMPLILRNKINKTHIRK